MGTRFVYDGEVWANQYGLALRDEQWSYLQQELAEQLGIRWTDGADWRGILRIEVELIAETPERQLDGTASDHAHAPRPAGMVERRKGERRRNERRGINLGGYVPPE